MSREEIEHQSGWIDGKRRWAPAVQWVRGSGIKTLLEIGTAYGTSLDGWVEAGCTDIVSLDIDTADYGLEGRFPTVKFFRGVDDRSMPSEVWDYISSKAWDLVVIDTSHEYLHTKQELKLLGRLNVRYAMFDDISWGSTPTDKGEGVALRESGIAINELSGTGVGWFEMNAENKGKIERLQL